MNTSQISYIYIYICTSLVKHTHTQTFKGMLQGENAPMLVGNLDNAMSYDILAYYIMPYHMCVQSEKIFRVRDQMISCHRISYDMTSYDMYDII